ncbi:MAG: glutamate--tRNA ligase [Candidatus Marinimicrobia bacterium]|nr:glutamate--tRNA ligase [Candidatus Neomarinimicrobiota bacterium]
MKKTPKVRFAPSPTGQLHLGGARTALFNYLFARKHSGQFYLRIEDTDEQRSKQEFVDQICASLRWMGLEWDGPIVYQSGRKEVYQERALKLLSNGMAYHCFCTKEQLSAERQEAVEAGETYKYSGVCRDLSQDEVKAKMNAAEPFCVRVAVPEGKTNFSDRVYGEIEVDNREIDDFIIQRTNGTPTYNFTVVVDDSDMEVTHVIRGEDHLTNTPKQLIIYQALDRQAPQFAHVPMILGPDGRRLSKRHDAKGVHEYQFLGYLAEALANYLALLGWSHGDEREIFTVEELVKEFSVARIVKKAAVFDEQKLTWVSGQHMMGNIPETLLERIHTLNPDWRTEVAKETLLNIVDIQKGRVKTLVEIMENSDFFFDDPERYDRKTSNKRWKDRTVNELVEFYVTQLESLQEWNESTLEEVLKTVTDEKGLSPGKLIHPARLALTGVPHGPSLFLLMEMIGKETCLRRLAAALERLPSANGDFEESSP